MAARAGAAAGRYDCLRQVLRTDIHPDNRNAGHQLRQVSPQNQRVGAPPGLPSPPEAGWNAGCLSSTGGHADSGRGLHGSSRGSASVRRPHQEARRVVGRPWKLTGGSWGSLEICRLETTLDEAARSRKSRLSGIEERSGSAHVYPRPAASRRPAGPLGRDAGVLGFGGRRPFKLSMNHGVPRSPSEDPLLKQFFYGSDGRGVC